jgi:YVTN family beta-propeller protein
MRSEHYLRCGLGLAGALALADCGGGAASGTGGSSTSSSSSGATAPVGDASGTTVSSTLALTKDDRHLWVVNPDEDSVSVIDTKTRLLVDEIPLGTAPPAVDPTTKRFEPKVLPRALAIVGDAKVYVAGESANRVFVVDATKHTVLSSIAVPAAPVSVAAAPDGSAVYVVSHEAAVVTQIDPRTDTVVNSLPVTQHPWGASVSQDGKTLFVTHILLEPGVSVINAKTLSLEEKVAFADQPQGSDPRVPNGVARGLYGVTPVPTTGEVWVAHMLLGTKTAQPALDFETTAFPTISTLTADGSAAGRRLLFQPSAVPGAVGSFSDSISGPHAIAFTPDGKLALMANAQSEDVMLFDVATGFEAGLVRPLPSALLEGIVVDHTGKLAYVEGRNTHDVTVLAIDEANTITPAAVDGDPIERIGKDPMPAQLRQGQRLFYTANSSAFPITSNFWMSCSTCHIEGGSDAVTWLFAQGPRDTPSNAGGPINTGFLFRQALRNDVDQYDEVIQTEMGGTYDLDQDMEKPALDALAAFVNYAIPFPQNPNLAPAGVLTASQKRGQATFATECASCHKGDYLTDSGDGNASLSFSGTILLHDIGTCVTTGAFPDQTDTDLIGNVHAACMFDTPTLRGIFATPPYLHDGSAATLADAVDRIPFASGLSAAEKADLVAYLETL